MVREIAENELDSLLALYLYLHEDASRRKISICAAPGSKFSMTKIITFLSMRLTAKSLPPASASSFPI